MDVPGALRYPDFRWYTAARLLWAFASQMLIVAVGFQVYTITHNPLDLGLIGLSQFLPFIVLTLPAGHIADTFDRRKILLFCYGLLTVCATCLAVVSIAAPSSAGPIIVLMILYGAARALALPTAQSLVPNLVPTSELPSAVAFTSTMFQVATITGPAIGGLLLLGGPQLAYGTTVVFLAAATLLMTRLKTSGRADGGERKAMTITTLFSGVQFVRSRPIVIGSISLDMFAVFFGGAVALLPIYATDILDVGPTGLGLMRAAPAVGALLAAITLGIRPLRRRVGPWLFGSVATFGVGTVVFAVSTAFPVTLLALAVMGCSDMISVYVRNLVVQLATPDDIRGRVSAVNGVFVGASNELGEFESGVTAAWWGPIGASLVGGVATISVALLWAILFPSLRTMDRLPDSPRAADVPTAGEEVAERSP